MDLSQFDIDVVAARLKESVFTESLKACGVEFYQLSGKLRSPANGRAFFELLRKQSYDVVYLNIFQGLSFYYGYLAQKAGVPVRIAHSHGAGLRNGSAKGLKLCLHRLGKRLWSSSITDFWSCSHNAAEFLFPRGQMYQWIPDGIETECFHFRPVSRKAERAALGLSDDTFLVGTVGRLSEEKNHSFLLKVFYELKKMRKNSALVIVGTGHLEDHLRMQTRELGLEKDVIFYGSSPQVERLLWAMDVFVFPSYMEGFGIAGVEAQAAGLPVLCSEAIPSEAVVTGQTVRLALSAGAKAWAEQVLKMEATDRESSAKTVAAADFDIQTVAEQIKRRWMNDQIE